MTITDNKNYKKTLSKFTTGITVICVKKGDDTIGKTVNSFNSLSLKPPLVLFSLGKEYLADRITGTYSIDINGNMSAQACIEIFFLKP